MQNDFQGIELIQFLTEEINLTKNRLKNANEAAINIEIDLLNQQVLSLYNAIQKYKNVEVQSPAEKIQPVERVKLVEKATPEIKAQPAEEPKILEKPAQAPKAGPKPELQEKIEKEVLAPVAEVLLEEQKATPQILEIKEEKKPESIVIEYKATAPEPAEAGISLNQKLHSNSQSLNDKFAKQQTVKNLSDKLKLSPITDLRTGISLNQKLSFIKQLFSGDDSEYKKVVTLLNNSKNFTEAKYYIQNEIEPKHGWNEGNPLVEEFMELVYRKFL